MERSNGVIGRRVLRGLVRLVFACAVLGGGAGRATAQEREPFREPEWVSMPTTEDGVRAAREALSRAQRVYAGIRNYEHVGVTKRYSRVIGSRSKDDWAEEEKFAAAFDRATGRYMHEARGCGVWFDGERVVVRMDALKAYRTAESNTAAAPKDAESLGDTNARLPMSLSLIRGAGEPLDALLESMHMTELVGVIPEKRDGKDGKWVVMASHHEVGERGVRLPRRLWFDDETGMMRMMEADESAWIEAQSTDDERGERARVNTITLTRFTRVAVDAPHEPATLAFRPRPGDTEVTAFLWPPCGAGQPEQPEGPMNNENPEMVDRINHPLAAFKAKLAAGGEVTNDSLLGKPVLIGFGLAGESSADLPYQYQRILDEHKDKLRVLMFLAGAEMLTKRGLQEAVPGSFTGDVATVSSDWVKATFGIRSFATAMLVDDKGIVREVKQGGGAGERDFALETTARQLVSGELAWNGADLAKRRKNAQEWSDHWQKLMPRDSVFTSEPPGLAVGLPAKIHDHAVLGEGVPVGWSPSDQRPWFDIDNDGVPELIIPASGGKVQVVRLDGKEVEPIALDADAISPAIQVIRPVRTGSELRWLAVYYDMGGDRESGLHPPRVVECFDGAGRRLWRYEPPAVVTPQEEESEFETRDFTAATTDLTGDGVDELLVGINITRFKRTNRDSNSFSGIGTGRVAVLTVLDAEGKCLSVSEFGAKSIRWIEPVPGTRSVLALIDSDIRRIEFKDVKSP